MDLIDRWGVANFDCYAFKAWLGDNIDVAIYCSAGYLALVFWAPPLIEKYIPATKKSEPIMRKCWMLWNMLLVLFSFYGASRVVPAALHNLRTMSMHDSICVLKEEQFYKTEVGFAMALFTISKLPEFVDTVFLLLTGKYKLPFLSWFHHISVFLFAWSSYQDGSSIYVYAAAMNYTVHTIMYFYFCLAEAGFKNGVKPAAPYITILQILQMVYSIFISTYVCLQKLSAISAGVDHKTVCTGTSFANARIQLVIYTFYFFLFSNLFYKQNVARKASAKPKAQ